MLFAAFYCNAQTDSIKLKVINFLIEQGEIDSIQDKSQYFDNVYITNLIYGHNNKQCAIYKIGVTYTHSFEYLMIKTKNDYTLLDLDNLDKVLILVINLLKQNKVSNNEIVANIEAIIGVYQKNLKAIPWY
jgi:hypothetical protein